MFKKIIFGITLSVFLVSCASIVKGTKQTITINSNVDGATVYLDGIMVGTTPFVGDIKKNKAALTIQKEGYKTYTLSLSKSLEPMFFGNIITGGTLGSITDFATGAAYTYSPSSYQIEMYKDGESSTAFLQRLEVRKYAMLNITDISADLGNGDGEYLQTLIELADQPYNDESKQIVSEAFEMSHGNEVVFGKHITDLIEK